MSAGGEGGPESVQDVLILADTAKAKVRELLAELLPWLEHRVTRTALEEDVKAFCDAQRARLARDASAAVPDLVLVLGGDGALLGAVRAFAERPVPTLGINFGRVGFLASTPASHWRETLAGVLAGDGIVEPRMRLAAVLRSPGRAPVRGVALNEVVVVRGSHQGMLTAALSVGDTFVTDYRADGLIVATPSGSTAYSLSSGGPILAPHMRAIVVTPICSHGLANRPIVLQPDSHLRVAVTRSSGITTVVLDGQTYYAIEQGATVDVEQHPVPYPLLAMPGLDPYRRLRERLGWGVHVANDLGGDAVS